VSELYTELLTMIGILCIEQSCRNCNCCDII